uniref:hypothetical protein n=1 Tax=uncultured Parolsenella sp. TaxID=2083008 RepID=UPI0027DD8529
VTLLENVEMTDILEAGEGSGATLEADVDAVDIADELAGVGEPAPGTSATDPASSACCEKARRRAEELRSARGKRASRGRPGDLTNAKARRVKPEHVPKCTWEETAWIRLRSSSSRSRS